VPTQQRVRLNEKRRPARPAKKPAGRSKENPVGLVQPRTGDLAAKNREFVSEHHDLELLEPARAKTQRRERKRTPKQQVHQRHHHEAVPLRSKPKEPRPYGRTAPSTIASGARWIYVLHGLRAQSRRRSRTTNEQGRFRCTFRSWPAPSFLSSKPVRRGNPTLGRFDSGAAPLSQLPPRINEAFDARRSPRPSRSRSACDGA
jgi:hypothetical protein